MVHYQSLSIKRLQRADVGDETIIHQGRVLSFISRVLLRIPMEHVETKDRRDSELQIGSICSIEILNILRDI